MFIRATRIIDWDLHLLPFRSMIPWYFACDKVNYSRYGSAYWLEMTVVLPPPRLAAEVISMRRHIGE